MGAKFMEAYNESRFRGYLVKGELRGAVDYLSRFNEKEELFNKYIRVFENNNYINRTDNVLVMDIDKLYQKYYINIFWKELDKEEARGLLYKDLTDYCLSLFHPIESEYIEDEIKKLVEKEGFKYLGGYTSGLNGPYIWKESNMLTYNVDLPNGKEDYTVVMMEGFISRSWLDFISFGSIGAGGWIGKDGNLSCVKESYDLESDGFKVSFLKHEAQHGYDIRNFKGISDIDLEYRAKLVELIYLRDSDNLDKIKNIINEADKSNPDNSHAMASYRIVTELSRLLFKSDYVVEIDRWQAKLQYINKLALDLFKAYENPSYKK